jgi:predicted enzyme related to lactoylglutathione lyase
MSRNILCWTDIPVTDLDRAIAFYSAVLAEPVVKQGGEGWEMGLLPHAGEGASGCLSAMEENQPTQTGPLIYLSVSGRLDAAIAAVSENGGSILQEKHQIGPYGYRAVIVDSEGNRLALHSETE